MDAEFILVSMKQRELAEKVQFFERVLKMGNFGQNAERGLFAKLSKLAIF